MNTRRSNPTCAAIAIAALMGSMLAAHPALGQPPSTIAATAQSFDVAAPDIHDIRGPKPVVSPWLVPLVALTTLLAMGGAYAAWVWNRRRFQEASKRPLDIALERLDQARPLMAPPRGREFSIEVSSAVREYIESRFELQAAHLTTDEFLHQLLEPVDSVLSLHRVLLDNFLQTCDLAKFGGWNLASADMQSMLESARQFIVASAGVAKSRSTAPAPTNAVGQSIASTLRETYVSLPSA